MSYFFNEELNIITALFAAVLVIALIFILYRGKTAFEIPLDFDETGKTIHADKNMVGFVDPVNNQLEKVIIGTQVGNLEICFYMTPAVIGIGADAKHAVVDITSVHLVTYQSDDWSRSDNLLPFLSAEQINRFEHIAYVEWTQQQRIKENIASLPIF
ncbi:MAG: hypothetical protein EO766_13480 [Hydrotalea sp. AMD]|uniref:hypothetical protein n=1 Tax=Hydrotalea sp. AMD TaxID=2501297 RepID=UPI001025CB43|nr:hypothetical protein [Hydrotalea sp. AMD]RWZ86812.1 MAG: hypothetical protein EO766_13480 [Hydrotalea sp. AMD]